MTYFKRIRIKKVSRVALCEAGANLIHGLYKSTNGDESLTLVPLAKSAMNEQGLLHIIAYAPYMVDDHKHFMGPEDVRASCHSFAETGMELDLNHGKEPLSKEKARVVENMILAGEDSRFPTTDNLGRKINHQGAWAVVLHLKDEELRKQAREGKLAEVSLFAAKGDYSLELVPDAELPPSLKKSTEQVMDQAKLEALFAAQTAALSKSINEAFTAAPAPLTKAKDDQTKDDKKKDDEKFDPTDVGHLAKMAFNADMNDIYAEFELDPANLQAGIAALGREQLESYRSKVEEAKERNGLSKSKTRTTPLKRDSNNGGEQTWDDVFGNQPLVKSTQNRLKRTSRLN